MSCQNNFLKKRQNWTNGKNVVKKDEDLKLNRKRNEQEEPIKLE